MKTRRCSVTTVSTFTNHFSGSLLKVFMEMKRNGLESAAYFLVKLAYKLSRSQGSIDDIHRPVIAIFSSTLVGGTYSSSSDSSSASLNHSTSFAVNSLTARSLSDAEDSSESHHVYMFSSSTISWLYKKLTIMKNTLPP